MVEPVEDDRQRRRARHRQHLLGGEQALVVLDDQPSAHGLRQRPGDADEPLHRGLRAVRHAAHMDDDLGRRVRPEGVEESRVPHELQDGGAHHRRAHGIEHRELAGMH